MALLGLFGKEDYSVFGVDIGSSAIKIVQIRKKNGQAVLETYGELALGPYANATIGQAVLLPTEKISEALKNLMAEKEVSVTTAKCGISIPFGSSLMSVIEMPAVSEKQLASMVPLEARKYIPVPISEVMLDWSIIPRSEARPDTNEEKQLKNSGVRVLPKLDILVVAIHNETISRYKEIVQSSGLDASFFEIEIFSSMRAIVEENLKPVMIMDMGAASTKLYIVERGIIKSSHTVNRGAQDITSTISKSLGISSTDAEIMKRQIGAKGDKTLIEVIEIPLEYIFAEANRIILAFEKKYNKAVAKTVLIGGGAALKGLSELAKQSLKTEVQAGNPFEKLSAPAFIEEVLKDTGPEFAVAVGLALRRLSEEE